MTTALGWTPEQIDDTPWHDIVNLFDYWGEHPPTNEILAAVYKIRPKADRDIQERSEHDPSGIGALVRMFPNGRVLERR